MTFLETYKIISSGLIQWPFRRSEWADAVESFKILLWYGLILPLLRLIALVILPISATILTYIVHNERKRIAKHKKEYKDFWRIE